MDGDHSTGYRQLIGALGRHGDSEEPLDEQRTDELRRVLAARYADAAHGEGGGRLLVALSDVLVVKTPVLWLWIEDQFRGQRTFLLLDEPNSLSVFEVADGGDITGILRDAFAERPDGRLDVDANLCATDPNVASLVGILDSGVSILGGFARERFSAVKRVGDEVRQAISLTGVDATALDGVSAEAVRQTVADRYAGGVTRWLWEHWAVESASAAMTWEEVDALIAARTLGGPVLMFFDSWSDRTVFRFADGRDVPTVLAECYMFEYYLTDPSVSFVVSHNHHDVLSAVGRAKAWVEEYKEARREAK
jgi:hypothetical protein